MQISFRKLFRPLFLVGAAAISAGLILLLKQDSIGGFATMYKVGNALNHLATLGLCGLATVILARRDMRDDERLLTAALVLAAWSRAVGEVYIAFTHVHPPPVIGAISLATGVFAVASFIRFTAVFPVGARRHQLPHRSQQPLRGLWTSDVRVLIERFGSARVGLWRFAAGLSAAFSLLVFMQPNEALGSLGWALASLVYAFGLPAAVAAGAVNLRDGYRSLEPQDQRRVLWVVAGFTAAATCVVADTLIMLSTELLPVVNFAPLWNLSAVLWAAARFSVLGGLTMATFYAGAFNPRNVIKASTYSGIIGTASVFAAAIADNVISSLVTQAAGTTAAWIAAGVVALLSRPIIHKIRERAALSFGRDREYLTEPNKDRSDRN